MIYNGCPQIPFILRFRWCKLLFMYYF